MKHVAPDMSRIPGGCLATGHFPPIARNLTYLIPSEATALYELGDSTAPAVEINQWRDEILHLEDLLTPASCTALRTYYEAQGSFAPVSVQGMAPEGAGAKVGSQRISCWDPAFGKALWDVLKPFLECTAAGNRRMTDLSATDWWQGGKDLAPKHRHWRAIGVTPMARYMRYERGGQHFAHYDAGYQYLGGRQRTLMSGVLYLTTNKTGATCFVRDGQEGVSVWDRVHDDWVEPIKKKQIIASYLPHAGSVLLFDHRLCHAVQPYTDTEGPRIIIRFDVIFQAYNALSA